MACSARWSRRRGGYTLIELAVVLSIFAMVAALSVPNFIASEGSAEAAAVRSLSEVFGAARDAAVVRGATTEVRIRAADGTWTMLVRAQDGVGWDTLGGGRVAGAEVHLDGASGPWSVMRFDAWGRASGGSVVVSGPEEAIAVRPETWTTGVRVARP